MTTDWQICKADGAHIKTLTDFNLAMALETEGKSLDQQIVFRGVQRLLDHSEYGFYLIGEHEGRCCGSLMITFEWSDWRDGLFWWIQSVYVSPLHRRKGLFRALYNRVIQMAQNSKDAIGIRLYVEKDNQIASETYTALGMSETHYRLYEIEF